MLGGCFATTMDFGVELASLARMSGSVHFGSPSVVL